MFEHLLHGDCGSGYVRFRNNRRDRPLAGIHLFSVSKQICVEATAALVRSTIASLCIIGHGKIRDDPAKLTFNDESLFNVLRKFRKIDLWIVVPPSHRIDWFSKETEELGAYARKMIEALKENPLLGSRKNIELTITFDNVLRPLRYADKFDKQGQRIKGPLRPQPSTMFSVPNHELSGGGRGLTLFHYAQLREFVKNFRRAITKDIPNIILRTNVEGDIYPSISLFHVCPSRVLWHDSANLTKGAIMLIREVWPASMEAPVEAPDYTSDGVVMLTLEREALEEHEVVFKKEIVTVRIQECMLGSDWFERDVANVETVAATERDAYL